MLLNVFRVLAKRWYVVLIGLLLTAGLGFGAMLTTPSEFKSRALILLLPSEEAVGESGNPFLALTGLEQPASLVSAYFTSSEVQEEVAARSETATYRVALDAAVRSPVILVEVTDATAAQSLATLDYLTERIPEELRRLQEEVDATEGSIIGTMPLTRDAEAVEDSGPTIRIVIAALAVGLAGTVFLTFGVDSLLARRSTRRAESSQVPDLDGPPDDAGAFDLPEHLGEVGAAHEMAVSPSREHTTLSQGSRSL